MQKTTPERMYFIDNIKWVLAIIVIFHHSIEFNKQYFPNYIDVFGFFTTFNQSYFMDLFFFISAFFLIPSFIKKGKHSFNKDKIIRLGSVVLLTIVFIGPVIFPLLKHLLGISSTSYLSWLSEEFLTLQWGLPMEVTWFCWTLLVFTLVWSQFANKVKCQTRSEQPLPSFFKIILFCVFMVPINYLAVQCQHILGDGFLGFMHLGYFPSYIACFIFGLQSYQKKWLQQINVQYGIFGLFLFVVSFGVILIVKKDIPSIIEYMRTFNAIGMTLFILYIFKAYLNLSNPVTKVLARASFPAYVVQLLFVFPLIYYVSAYLKWNPLFIVLVEWIIATICAFVLGIILYRLPIFRRIF